MKEYKIEFKSFCYQKADNQEQAMKRARKKNNIKIYEEIISVIEVKK
jgi:hypothetical protein